MNAESYSAILAEAKQSVDYWKDISQTDFARDVHRHMQEKGVSLAELAQRMETSEAQIRRLLDDGNFTLVTMVKIAMTLGSVVRIHLEGHEERAPESGDELPV